MLGDAPLIAFVPVTDVGTASEFYVGALGLAVTKESPFALVVDAGGAMLRLTPVENLRPQPFTIAGWQVIDIAASIDGLVGRGVTFVIYDGMDQDHRGVWSAPSGDRVAWFKDPDGNTLSLTQFSR
jgi:catechol 2,3-dioxygenase-like lactoylglutathione lyase family enzyme